MVERRWSGGRILTLDGFPHRGQPLCLTEFGGIALFEDGGDLRLRRRRRRGGWHLGLCRHGQRRRVRAFVHRADRGRAHHRHVQRFCYTQFADTFQEANGLLRADRSPEVPAGPHGRRRSRRRAHEAAAVEPRRRPASRGDHARRPRRARSRTGSSWLPDGRALTLYGLEPVTLETPVPEAGALSPAANPHPRWHPLRGEWRPTPRNRQERTLAAAENPLRPSGPGDAPTELPRRSLRRRGVRTTCSRRCGRTPTTRRRCWCRRVPRPAPAKWWCIAGSAGAARGAAAAAPDLLLQVWGERTARLGARDDVQYVLPFENRGVEVGVTLHHPHGQLYAYLFVPPVPARMQAEERRHYDAQWPRAVAR